jgi:hypothetical protein
MRCLDVAVQIARSANGGTDLAIQHYRAGDKAGAVDAFLCGVFGPGYRAAFVRGLPCQALGCVQFRRHMYRWSLLCLRVGNGAFTEGHGR